MNRETLTPIVLEVVRSRAVHFCGELGLETPLGSDGLGIDSIGVLEIILELEKQTGIILRDETITAETLATPRSLIEHLAASERGKHG